jgi:hypothetical protein
VWHFSSVHQRAGRFLNDGNGCQSEPADRFCRWHRTPQNSRFFRISIRRGGLLGRPAPRRPPAVVSRSSHAVPSHHDGVNRGEGAGNPLPGFTSSNATFVQVDSFCYTNDSEIIYGHRPFVPPSTFPRGIVSLCGRPLAVSVLLFAPTTNDSRLNTVLSAVPDEEAASTLLRICIPSCVTVISVGCFNVWPNLSTVAFEA